MLLYYNYYFDKFYNISYFFYLKPTTLVYLRVRRLGITNAKRPTITTTNTRDYYSEAGRCKDYIIIYLVQSKRGGVPCKKIFKFWNLVKSFVLRSWLTEKNPSEVRDHPPSWILGDIFNFFIFFFTISLNLTIKIASIKFKYMYIVNII